MHRSIPTVKLTMIYGGTPCTGFFECPSFINGQLMKNLVLVLGMLLSLSATGQRAINHTDTLLITGDVKREFTFTLHDLDTFAIKDIGDIVMSNQRGEI